MSKNLPAVRDQDSTERHNLAAVPMTRFGKVTPQQAIQDYAAVYRIAQSFSAAGIFKKKIGKGSSAKYVDLSVDEIAFMIQFGSEMGIGPAESMAQVHVQHGKATLGYNAVIGRYSDHGFHCDLQTEYDNNDNPLKTRGVLYGPNGKEYARARFTMEQARKAGLLKNPQWNSYPEDMLRARVVGRLWRMYRPHGLPSLWTTEEMVDVEIQDPGYRESVDAHQSQPHPPHRAEQTRHNHPSTLEVDAPKTGQAPPTPPPGEAVPVRKLQTKFLFAACNKLGWGKHNLYDIAEIDSVTALTQSKIDALTKRLENMDAATFQTDVSNVSVVQEYKTLLDQGVSSDMFEDYWTGLPWSDLTVNVKCALSNMRFNFYRKRLEEAREDELFLCYWEDTPATYKRCDEFKKFARQVNDLQEANAA